MHELTETQARLISVLWSLAGSMAAFYGMTLWKERRKRKQIDLWEKTELALIELNRKEKGL